MVPHPSDENLKLAGADVLDRLQNRIAWKRLRHIDDALEQDILAEVVRLRGCEGLLRFPGPGGSAGTEGAITPSRKYRWPVEDLILLALLGVVAGGFIYLIAVPHPFRWLALL